MRPSNARPSLRRLLGAATLVPAALLANALSPSAAQACGGLFCNVAQPVNQSAERILFAKDGDRVHMHVQIAYQGPPTEFGWLLPAPPDATPPALNAAQVRPAPLFQPAWLLFADGQVADLRQVPGTLTDHARWVADALGMLDGLAWLGEVQPSPGLS
jgi:hypothetical protein